MKNKKRKTLITLCVLMLFLTTSIGVAFAYFSDYDQAIGQATLYMNGETQIDEGDSDTEKNIVIKNVGNASVVVRVAVHGPDKMDLTVPDGWEKHGDFYYYKGVLDPGQNTGTAINASITHSDEELAELGNEFTITVVHESALAAFDSNGNVQKPAGWDYIPQIKK